MRRRHLPPSRTYTLSNTAVVVLALVSAAVLAILAGMLLSGDRDDTITTGLLDVLGNCVFAIAAAAGIGAGSLGMRDSMSKGATTSGAQIADAIESDAAEPAAP